MQNTSNELIAKTLLKLGFLTITSSIIVAFAIMLVLGITFSILMRSLQKEHPSTLQIVLEGAVTAAKDTIRSMLPEHVELVFPFIMTLWTFILVANLVGVIPGLSSPTSDLSVTSSLAFLVFLSVHWYGIKAEGYKNYFKHYLQPNFIMFPFHILSELSRTLALAVRLFGNVMSLQITAFFILLIAGFLVPIPILALHLIEAVLQAYIFGMLALIYIASGIQVKHL